MKKIIICSRTCAFAAMKMKAEHFGDAEFIIDHYTPGDFVYLFDEGHQPPCIDVAKIRHRETHCSTCGKAL